MTAQTTRYQARWRRLASRREIRGAVTFAARTRLSRGGRPGLRRVTVESGGPPDGPVVTVKGDVDLATAPALREHLVEILHRGAPAHLIVDLSQVTFMDSTGLGVLVGANRRVQDAGGHMTVVATEAVQRIMRLAGLQHLWTIVEQLADATGPANGPPDGPGGGA